MYLKILYIYYYQMQCNTMVASLYIPIIKSDITDEFIQKCFHEHNIGKVSHVDFVFNKQKSRREAFVHFSEWYDTEIAHKLKHKLENSSLSGEKCRFVYDTQLALYWPILINKKPLEKNSPERRSNDVYIIEERIRSIENSIQHLSFVSNVHDANIRYILRRSNSEGCNLEMPKVKRLKTVTGIANSSDNM